MNGQNPVCRWVFSVNRAFSILLEGMKCPDIPSSNGQSQFAFCSYYKTLEINDILA
jgi:hypothetical protein